MQASLFETAEILVRERIPGSRKGSDEPAYIHSLRVGEKIKKLGFNDDVVLAAMLHDIIEDGGVTADELSRYGFSHRTVQLVLLCSHDNEVEGGDARWIKMMANLIDARDAEAWSIKCADLIDNLKTSGTMPEDRKRLMREARGPFLIRLSYPQIAETPIWKELQSLVADLQTSNDAR